MFLPLFYFSMEIDITVNLHIPGSGFIVLTNTPSFISSLDSFLLCGREWNSQYMMCEYADEKAVVSTLWCGSTHTHTLPYTNAFCCLDNRSAETTFESGCEVHYVSVITIICSIHSNNMPLNVWCGCFSSSVFLPWYKKAIFAAEHEQFVTFSHQPVQPITFLSWQVISWHSKLLESPCCISWMTTFSLRKIICLRWAVKIRSIQDRETCYHCWFTPCMAFHAAYFLA